MIFKKLYQYLDSLTTLWDDKADGILAAVLENRKDIGDTREELKRVSLEIRKHNMSLEDVIESLEEKNETQDFLTVRLKSAEEHEEELLTLIHTFDENMFMLERFVEGPLEEQFHMMQKTVEKSMISCGTVRIGTMGEPVDYNYHEVIEVVGTADLCLNGTVAEVYSPGMVYQGKICRKARVSAYKVRSDDVVDQAAISFI